MTPTPLPLASAQARLGRPGRPRTRAVSTPENGDRRVTAPLPTRMNSGPEGHASVRQASALSPRLLSVAAAAAYLSLSEDIVLELLETGTFHRVTVPAPVTAKRHGGAIRKVLLDREEIDRLVATWKA